MIDSETYRLFYEVVEYGPRFAHGGLARMFVMEQNKAGDELAIKALRIVFVSKAGTQSKAKK